MKLPGHLEQANPAAPIQLKNVLLSRTMLFSALAILCKYLGIEEHRAQTLANDLLQLWPVWAAIFVDIQAMVARWHQTEFHRPSPAVWLTLISAAVSVAGAFGLDLSGMESVTTRVMDAVPASLAAVASICAVWGQLKARRVLVVKPVPGQLLMLALLLTALPASALDRKLGWKQDKAGVVDAPLSRLRLAPGTIVSHTDLRKQMPPVYDQGQVGSCTGNGIAAILDYARRKANARRSWIYPSRLFIYFCERDIEGTTNEDAGAMIRTGIDVITDLGAARERRWPYIERNWSVRPPAKAYSDAGDYQVLHGYKVENTDGRSIRLALSNGYPVVFGAYLYSGIDRVSIWKTTLDMPSKGERPLGGHCMVIVGHDDQSQLYTVRNSWGVRWADNGHFYIPYAYIHSARITGDCWVIDQAE